MIFEILAVEVSSRSSVMTIDTVAQKVRDLKELISSIHNRASVYRRCLSGSMDTEAMARNNKRSIIPVLIITLLLYV